jgi:hypothetical protein
MLEEIGANSSVRVPNTLGEFYAKVTAECAMQLAELKSLRRKGPIVVGPFDEPGAG